MVDKKLSDDCRSYENHATSYSRTSASYFVDWARIMRIRVEKGYVTGAQIYLHKGNNCRESVAHRFSVLCLCPCRVLETVNCTSSAVVMT